MLSLNYLVLAIFSLLSKLEHTLVNSFYKNSEVEQKEGERVDQTPFQERNRCLQFQRRNQIFSLWTSLTCAWDIISGFLSPIRSQEFSQIFYSYHHA